MTTTTRKLYKTISVYQNINSTINIFVKMPPKRKNRPGKGGGEDMTKSIEFLVSQSMKNSFDLFVGNVYDTNNVDEKAEEMKIKSKVGVRLFFVWKRCDTMHVLSFCAYFAADYR